LNELEAGLIGYDKAKFEDTSRFDETKEIKSSSRGIGKIE
jgi:hypothetical protein